MRPGIAAVAFDLDGTLYPNYRLYARLLPFILKEWRLLLAFGRARGIFHHKSAHSGFASGAASDFASGAAAPQEAGCGTQPDFYAEQAAAVAAILGAPQELVQAKIETLIYRGWEPYFKKVKLYGGVPQALEALRSAGLKLGLLSDFPPENKIKYLGIGDYWDAALCTEVIGRLKPDPLPFIKLAQALDTKPANILYVGNSLKYDVAGAWRAGMQTALIHRSVWSTGMRSKNKDGCTPDFAFRDYRQLCDFVLG